MKKSIPLWVNLVAILLTLSGFAFSINLYLSPQTFFPKTDFLAIGVRHFTDMWAIRQFAIGALFSYALIRQDAIILKTMIIFVTLINVITIPIVIIKFDKQLLIESLIFSVIGIAMIFAISKRQKYINTSISN